MTGAVGSLVAVAPLTPFVRSSSTVAIGFGAGFGFGVPVQFVLQVGFGLEFDPVGTGCPDPGSAAGGGHE